MKRIFVLIGSASSDSSNHRLAAYIEKRMQDTYQFDLFSDLKTLPHFDPLLSTDNPPESVLDLRQRIAVADGIIISSPEYVFSLPAGLKNALEWCVSTTLFTDKPCAIITASADGRKAHEDIQLIMQTLMASLSDDTNLLIQGIKSKINKERQIVHAETEVDLEKFCMALDHAIKRSNN
jgi:chromate reductase, NAD(P)H dehydrogenase (quinone)